MKYFTLIGLFMLTFQFNSSAQLACNDMVFISLDENGEAMLFADMFLEGSLCSNCPITISDPAGNILYGPELNPVLDCFDTFYELTYEISDASNSNSCWGTIQLSDMLGVCDFGGPALTIDGHCSVETYQLVLNNDELLGDLSPCVRLLPDLENGTNEVSFTYANSQWGLNGLSTLDLVLMQQGIFNQTMTPIEAIITDLDDDGAISTIDLVSFRMYILGILDATDLETYRIIDLGEDFTDFNPYGFDNHYQMLQFEDDYFDTNNNIDVAIHKIGDMNLTAVTDTLTNEIESEVRSKSMIQYDNLYLEAGESYEVEFKVELEDLKGLTFGLDIDDADIHDIHSNQDANILSNILDEKILISYLSLNPVDQLTFSIELTATSSGRFADKIKLNSLLSNDAVNDALNIFNIDLIPYNINLLEETVVYPNPASEIASIAFSKNFVDMKKEIEIRDLSGRLIQTHSTYADQFQINRSSVNGSGLYLIETKIGSDLIRSKVLFQ